MKKNLILIFILFSGISSFAANDTLPNPIIIQEECQAEASQFINHLDSFVINAYFQDVLAQTRMNDRNDSNSESIMADDRHINYAKGLMELNKNTPFELTYNEYVSTYIDVYVYRKRNLTEACMGLSAYYFPIFEEALDKHNLPEEFKYLAVVESALNIKARSRAGAAGLWQFMYRTGKYYGLTIDNYIDERHELYASTDAACRYFKDLYNIYGNWELVIAAYNCGPGNVNKAIRRSGGKRNFWEIREFLPKETRSYVPAFIAVNYAMNYSMSHGLMANLPDSLDLITDTISIKGYLNINHISGFFCANEKQLLYLNPSYKSGIVPDNGKTHIVRLPIGLLNEYLTMQSSYNQYVFAGSKAQKHNVVVETKPVLAQESTHIVKRGEVLGSIAERYSCSVTQLKEWNNIESSRIYEGQKLTIYSTKNTHAQTITQRTTEPLAPNNSITKYHVIKAGDTLWDIANMYDGLTLTELKRMNNNIDHKKLKPGDKLIVSIKS